MRPDETLLSGSGTKGKFQDDPLASAPTSTHTRIERVPSIHSSAVTSPGSIIPTSSTISAGCFWGTSVVTVPHLGSGLTDGSFRCTLRQLSGEPVHPRINNPQPHASLDREPGDIYREFQHNERSTGNRSKIDNSLENIRSLQVQYEVGRPFHRPKIHAMDSSCPQHDR